MRQFYQRKHFPGFAREREVSGHRGVVTRLELKMETSDRQLMICGKWAVASDGMQWILQRQNGSHWRNVSFVRSTKDILAQRVREKDCPPEVAQRLLEAVSRRFADAPYGRATRPGNIASCTPVLKRHSPSSTAVLSQTLHQETLISQTAQA
jgi:hypothetical protein